MDTRSPRDSAVSPLSLTQVRLVSCLYKVKGVPDSLCRRTADYVFNHPNSSRLSNQTVYKALWDRKNGLLEPHEILYLEAYKVAFSIQFTPQAEARLAAVKNVVGWPGVTVHAYDWPKPASGSLVRTGGVSDDEDEEALRIPKKNGRLMKKRAILISDDDSSEDGSESRYGEDKQGHVSAKTPGAVITKGKCREAMAQKRRAAEDLAFLQTPYKKPKTSQQPQDQFSAPRQLQEQRNTLEEAQGRPDAFQRSREQPNISQQGQSNAFQHIQPFQAAQAAQGQYNPMNPWAGMMGINPFLNGPMMYAPLIPWGMMPGQGMGAHQDNGSRYGQTMGVGLDPPSQNDDGKVQGQESAHRENVTNLASNASSGLPRDEELEDEANEAKDEFNDLD
ncbi:hypothetical protein F4805DRAFT_463809 [Annulohypoxylon moriforme]|nr:hypothetical protein F4805DRAFT_463809 [Annulohypoxylon moriforme]